MKIPIALGHIVGDRRAINRFKSSPFSLLSLIGIPIALPIDAGRLGAIGGAIGGSLENDGGA